MAQQGGQDREWVEVGDAFDPFAVAQPEAVDVGPFEDVGPDSGAQPEFNKNDVVVAAPVVDLRPQAGKAGEEPLKLRLRGLDPNSGRRKWLHEYHVGMQKFR